MPMKKYSPACRTLHCAICQKNKQYKEFSERQLMWATNHPQASYYYKNPAMIMCMACTPPQVAATLTCAICMRMKPRGAFAKLCFRSNDVNHARCLKCMKKREEEDVEDSDPRESSSEGSNSYPFESSSEESEDEK